MLTPLAKPALRAELQTLREVFPEHDFFEGVFSEDGESQSLGPNIGGARGPQKSLTERVQQMHDSDAAHLREAGAISALMEKEERGSGRVNQLEKTPFETFKEFFLYSEQFLKENKDADGYQSSQYLGWDSFTTGNMTTDIHLLLAHISGVGIMLQEQQRKNMEIADVLAAMIEKVPGLVKEELANSSGELKHMIFKLTSDMRSINEKLDRLSQGPQQVQPPSARVPPREQIWEQYRSDHAQRNPAARQSQDPSPAGMRVKFGSMATPTPRVREAQPPPVASHPEILQSQIVAHECRNT